MIHRRSHARAVRTVKSSVGSGGALSYKNRNEAAHEFGRDYRWPRCARQRRERAISSVTARFASTGQSRSGGVPSRAPTTIGPQRRTLRRLPAGGDVV